MLKLSDMPEFVMPAFANTWDVWLVENHDLYRETIADLIQTTAAFRCSYTFTCCEDALIVLDQGHLPNIVLMDIGLPGMGGVEGAAAIKKRAPNVHIVMVTVHQDNDTIFAALCAGATGYLLKTARPARIIEALEQVQRGGSPMDAQIARRVLDRFTHLTLPQADYGLTEREREILHHLAEGLTKPKIAERLNLSRHTIDGHIRNIYTKLQVHTSTGAVAKAVRERLI